MKTCKQLTETLNKVNETSDIKVVKEHGYYIIKMGGYESEFCYTLKELVNEIINKETIKMTFDRWTMSGIKTTTIKGIK